jgi:Galactose-3-O-sulfotransferase
LHKPDLLIFLHIGKTGGTTLSDVLVRNFPESRRFSGWSTEAYSAIGLYRYSAIKEYHDRLPRDQRRSFALLNGHVPFGVHAIFEQSAKYITLVREPADRAVSNFYYLLETPAEPLFYPHLKDMTFRDYVASDLCLDNSQVRALSGCTELGPQWDGSRPLRAAPVGPEHLEAAKRNIERHFLAAAPLECFTDLLVLLRLIFDWPLKAIKFTRRNVTKTRPPLLQIPIEVRLMISEKFRLDRELYDWVTARFRSQLQDLGGAFLHEREAFDRMNVRRSWWMRDMASAE